MCIRFILNTKFKADSSANQKEIQVQVIISTVSPVITYYLLNKLRMAEDKNPGDIHHAEVYRTDSNRRFVSTPLPYSCQIGQTNNTTNDSSLPNSDLDNNIPVDASNNDLNTYFSEMHCSNTSDTDIVNHAKSNVVKNKNDIVNEKQLENPVAISSTSRMISIFTPLYIKDSKEYLPQTVKRKRNSPQTRNVREKLLQYAYKDRSAKNVSFVLQADEDATNNVVMRETASSSSSASSISIEPIQQRSYTTLETALPPRKSRPVTRTTQHSEEIQTLPTEEEMRKYQVPDSKAPIWKLYEQKLRTVGRFKARIEVLTQEITDGNPPSWCFGGTQAPQHMRPFHLELVSLTLEYAMKMAITSRNILIREADQDAEQVRHLQETLMRMYKQDNDPNFELATGRAEGIAAHYTRKERALNNRLSDEDQTNIPTEVHEWADILCRRKVSKPNARSRSRSKSKDNNKKQKKSAPNKPSTSKNQKQNTKPYNGPPPPKKQQSQQQSGQSYQQWKNGKDNASAQAPRRSTSSTSVAPRTSTSANNHQGNNVQQTRPTPQVPPQSNVNPRLTNLNEEELNLITLLRASKK